MKYLELKGKRLPCIDAMPVGLIFDLAEGVDSRNESKQIAAMSRAIKAIVLGSHHDELHEALYATDNPVTFTDLNAALGTLMKEYAERPFTQSSNSPTGEKPTGATSRVVSLWRATDEADETSSKDGSSVAS